MSASPREYRIVLRRNSPGEVGQAQQFTLIVSASDEVSARREADVVLETLNGQYDIAEIMPARPHLDVAPLWQLLAENDLSVPAAHDQAARQGKKAPYRWF